MEMTPQMLEILKKAKQIDKAARKYETGAPKKSATSGLLDAVGGVNEDYVPTIKKDINSESYNQSVKKSKLPPAIQKAMLENPIPQGSFLGVDENAVRELRGLDEDFSYNENDEVDMYEKPVRRTENQKKKVIKEESLSDINVDETYLRKLIASEITKALPKIIENYFDSRLVKENVQFKAGSTIFSGTVMPMPKVKGKNNI